jgi:DNA-binding NarL/FixJ family response regulator
MSEQRFGVLIVDDHVLFRDGIRTLLQDGEGLYLVGEAGTGEEAIALAEERQPDVILMDIQLPGMDGIEATRQIMRASPHMSILMLTMFDDDQSVFAAMSAGALGYVLKGAAHDEMVRAIFAAAHRQAIFSPTIATRMMTFFARMQASDPRQLFPQLSERERDVLTAIARGQTNQEISYTLNVSLKTVQNHVSNILNKLQVVDRSQAILRAHAAGLGKDEA